MQARFDLGYRFVIADPIQAIHNLDLLQAHHLATNALASVTSAK
jgi:hypothetical protein